MMPLEKGSSKKVLRHNVEKLMHEVGKSPHVQSQKQAEAIAYSIQRKDKSKRKNKG